MQNAFVRKLSAYAALSVEETTILSAATSSPRTVAAQHDLIREGDQPASIFVVLGGWACRYMTLPNGSRQIVAFMLPGDFCDIHTGSLQRADHSVGTVTECQIASLSREKMETLLVSTPKLTRAFWQAQLTDQGIMRRWITNIGRRDAAERVGHLMLELCVRMQHAGLAANDECDMPLTQAVLADALGLTPVHINRVFRVLREREIMSFRAGRLVINNAAQLANLAGFDDKYLNQRIKQTGT